MRLQANGSTAAYIHPGGLVTAVIRGTFGGGTLAIEVSDDGTNWETPKDAQGNAAEYTEGEVITVELAAGIQVRGTLSGATGPDLHLNFTS
ncbi:MAG: hypothetical protein AAF636_11515 [Pseudomonadota bacterium]